MAVAVRYHVCLASSQSVALRVFSHVCYGQVEGILGVNKGKVLAIVLLGVRLPFVV